MVLLLGLVEIFSPRRHLFTGLMLGASGIETRQKLTSLACMMLYDLAYQRFWGDDRDAGC